MANQSASSGSLSVSVPGTEATTTGTQPPHSALRGRGRPRGDTREQTRAAIVAAARDAFARLGFAQATNREIASLAGVTASAIYPYFESKAALYMAVVRDSVAKITPHLRAATEDSQSTREALRNLLIALGSVDEGRGADTRFLTGVPIEMQRNPELSDGMLAEPGEVPALVEEIVMRGVRSGEIHPERAQRVVSFAITAMMGLSSYGLTLGAGHLELAVDSLVDMLDGTLLSPEPPTTRFSTE